MKIETGGSTFKALKWTASQPPKGSDLLHAWLSGPFTIIAYQKRGCAFFKVLVGVVQIGNETTLEHAKEVANAHAKQALAFGPRPVSVTK